MSTHYFHAIQNLNHSSDHLPRLCHPRSIIGTAVQATLSTACTRYTLPGLTVEGCPSFLAQTLQDLPGPCIDCRQALITSRPHPDLVMPARLRLESRSKVAVAHLRVRSAAFLSLALRSSPLAEGSRGSLVGRPFGSSKRNVTTQTRKCPRTQSCTMSLSRPCRCLRLNIPGRTAGSERVTMNFPPAMHRPAKLRLRRHQDHTRNTPTRRRRRLRAIRACHVVRQSISYLRALVYPTEFPRPCWKEPSHGQAVLVMTPARSHPLWMLT